MKFLFIKQKIKMSDEEKTIVKTNLESFMKHKNLDFPFVDDLVDTFYTKESIDLMKRSTKNNLDIVSFHFFQSLFLFCVISCEKNNKLTKENVKNTMNDTLNNPEKRKTLLGLYSKSILLLEN
jgi:hypothetical protein